MISIDIAVIDISSAISAMNSRNDSGKSAVVSSEMWMSGEFKRAYMQNAEAMRQVESLALEDQAVDWILAHANVREVKSTFKELMNFEA